MTHLEALEKVKRYCAYQDRCQWEVRKKLKELSAPTESVDTIISTLIEENFLDEERYSKSFARGKFYYKSWGKQKILQEFRQREISSYCQKAGLSEISDDDYQNTLQELFEKKFKELKEQKSLVNKAKIQKYLYNKGYEQELIYRLFDEHDW